MRHEFVDYIPERIEPDVLYVSIEHDTAVHICCCGCGNEVVTPLSPAEWSLTYDGRTVSMSPSIGNWSFPCKSHYYIRKGQVDWAARFSDEKIEAVRAKDKSDRDRVYDVGPEAVVQRPPGEAAEKTDRKYRSGFFGRIVEWLHRD